MTYPKPPENIMQFAAGVGMRSGPTVAAGATCGLLVIALLVLPDLKVAFLRGWTWFFPNRVDPRWLQVSVVRADDELNLSVKIDVRSTSKRRVHFAYATALWTDSAGRTVGQFSTHLGVERECNFNPVVERKVVNSETWTMRWEVSGWVVGFQPPGVGIANHSQPTIASGLIDSRIS